MVLGAAGSVVTGLVADLLGGAAFLGLAVLLGGMLAVLLYAMRRSGTRAQEPISHVEQRTEKN